MYDEELGIYFDKGKKIIFTRTESKIFSLLLENKSKHFTSYEEITNRIFKECNVELRRNSIILHISRMNKKLKGLVKINVYYKKGYYIDE